MAHVTLKTIATEAKVTTATVSMALRNHPSVAEGTRTRIHAIAERLGYRQNPHVTALMSHVRQARPLSLQSTLAVIHTFPQRTGWMEFDSDSRLMKGIRDRCQQLGFFPDILWYSEPNLSSARFSQILRERGVKGVIILPWMRHTAVIDLPWEDFAVTCINYNIDPPRLHCVAEDFFGNTCLAYEELWKHGCRRIGLAFKTFHEPLSQHRVSAAFIRMSELYLGPDGPRIEPLLIDDLYVDKIEAWCKRFEPDAVITFNWPFSKILPELGFRIPEDISLAVVTCCPNYAQYSGVDPHYERMGAAAVDLVAEQINNNEYGFPAFSKEVLIRGSWVEGQMIAPLPSPAS
jgi:LacI family transcriptional regulator